MTEVLFVFWLVVYGGGYSENTLAVIPVPYFSQEQCIAAAKTVRRADCVQQPITDVADWLVSQGH